MQVPGMASSYYYILDIALVGRGVFTRAAAAPIDKKNKKEERELLVRVLLASQSRKILLS
jgi:hypothetical protein